MTEDEQGIAASNGGNRNSASDAEVGSTSGSICFVISPFGGWFDSYFQEIYCPAIEAVGLQPRRADSMFRSSNIVHDIWHLVTTSRVLLADLTGKNPNVFYELGLAHAARKPVLLVTRTIEDVPFDLRALRIITYDVEHPLWGDLLRQNIMEGLEETLSAPEQAVLPAFLSEVPPTGPSVSPSEKSILELKQQINILSAQMRSDSFPGRLASRPLVIASTGLDAPWVEAIANALSHGSSEEDIERMLRSRQSSDWIQSHIAAAREVTGSGRPQPLS